MLNNILKDISPRIVHKENINDVLIYNSRPVIPVFLDKKFAEGIKVNLPNSYEELQSFYKFTGEKYVLKTLRNNISQHLFDKLVYELKHINIGEYYKKSGDHFILYNQWIPEYLETTFSRIFGLQQFKVTGEERCKIHEILSHVDGMELPNDGNFTLFNDAQNYFFYSKHHEHVPGLMIIEAARQCMYVHFYHHSGYERGEVTISILDLNCKFPNYTEACYSVEIIVKDIELDKKINGKNGIKVAYFYQNNILVAEVALKYMVIAMPIFNRMRNIKIPENYWFTPLKNLRSEVLIISKDDVHIQSELQFISMDELKIIIKDDLSNYNILELQEKLHHCILNVEGHGLIYMQVNPSKSFISIADNTAIINFVTIDKKQKELITKILKDYCYFIEEKSHSHLLQNQATESHL